MITVYDAVVITDGHVFVLSTEPTMKAAKDVIDEASGSHDDTETTFEVFEYEVNYDSFEDWEASTIFI